MANSDPRQVRYSIDPQPTIFATCMARVPAKNKRGSLALSVLGPLVLTADLFLLLGSEVVRNVERLGLRQYGGHA